MLRPGIAPPTEAVAEAILGIGQGLPHHLNAGIHALATQEGPVRPGSSADLPAAEEPEEQALILHAGDAASRIPVGSRIQSTHQARKKD